MRIAGETISEVAENLSQLRRYQPFRFSGKWFVGVFAGQGFAFRTKQPLQKKARENNLVRYEIGEIAP